jgi:hypothetical protein
MTLDEAIKHAEEVADSDCYNDKQFKCADEHRQLAEWLKDYKRMKEQEPTTKNNLGVREFVEIVVEYPPEELCTYPEYKGKPYFSIKYEEGNDCIIGYGTYNPQVLSRYLKDYFMPSTKNDLPHCQHTDEEIAKSFIVAKELAELPPVTPQAKSGRWITWKEAGNEIPSERRFECSVCHDAAQTLCNGLDLLSEFCPNCGARMVEPQESENT